MVAKRKAPKNSNQLDLFYAPMLEFGSKDARQTMSLPFLSISKKPRKTPIIFESKTANVYVKSSDYGIANIWDFDVVIWAISQIRQAMHRGEEMGPCIVFSPYSLLKSIKREASGTHYINLKKSLDRLTFTSIKTSITLDERKKETSFHWLDSWTANEDPNTGKPLDGWTITLSNWLYMLATNDGEVLKIDDNYFLLNGGLERFLYRIARQMAGKQEDGAYISLDALYRRSGTTRDKKYFTRDLKATLANGDFLDYQIYMKDETVFFKKKKY